jgi:1-acyl-sn-glycerol-3-phosphate acyltransferase
METPFLYRAGRILGRVILGLYFRRIEVAGADGTPARGPVILAANHPQSVTDALVLGLAVERPLHFIAHSGLFREPVTAFLLRHAGVIPVYRREDGGAGDGNVGMFRACRHVLERGGAIAIFPEGTSQKERRVQRVKTGTARIVLEAEAKNGFGLGVRILPVGITFESRLRFRSRVLVRIGTPLAASGLAADYARDPVRTVEALTADLRAALIDLVVNIERSDLEEFVEDVDSTYRDELLSRAEIRFRGESDLEKGVAVTREIARAADFYRRERPETVWRLRRLLREYRRKRERLHLSDAVLRGRDRSFRGEMARAGGLILAGLLPAAYGGLWNAIPYKAAGWAAKRAAPDETKRHWFQLSWGAFFYLLYYPPLLYAAYRLLGTAGASVFGASLVPTGFFARWYAGALARRETGLRCAYLTLTRGPLVAELRSLRAGIVAEMDAVLEDYVLVRGAPPPDSTRSGTSP